MTETINLTEARDDAGTSVATGPSREQHSVGNRIRAIVASHADAIGTVGASFGVFAIFAIQGVLMARLLGPEKRGEYGTIVLFTQALTYIGLLGTLLSIAGHAARNPDGLPNLRRAAVWLGSMTGIVTMIVVAGFALTALPADKRFLAPLCILCATMLPFDHIRLTLLAVDQGSGAFGRYNLNLLVNAGVMPILLFAFWIAGWSSLVLVTVATLLVPILSLVYRFATDGRGAIGAKPEPSPRSLLSESGPYAIAQASSNLFYRLDTLLILWFASLRMQGYYAAAVSTAGMMVVAPNALSLLTFRASAISEKRVSLRKVVSAGSAVVVMQLVILGMFLLALTPLIVTVFGDSFRDAVPFAQILLPAHAIGGMTYVAGGYLRGRRKPMVEVWSRIIGAAVMVGAVFLLHATWQEFSVPMAAICGHTTCAVILCAAVLADAKSGLSDSTNHAEALAI